MILSKATSAEWASDLSSGARCGLSLSPGFFVRTPASLPPPLGFPFAGAVPSGATSATRYELPERIFGAARVVAKLEFADVQRQVSFTGLVERTDDVALQQRPEAFDVLRVNRADNILPLGVIDDFVGVSRGQAAIANPLVGDKQGHLVGDGLPDKRLECRAIDRIDNLGDNFPGAADRPDDRLLARSRSARSGALKALADMPILCEAADESFINLDLAKEHLALVAVLHRDADAMAHVPSRLVRTSAEHPVDLVRRHALFRVVHQEGDLEPLDERVFGILEDRPSNDREPIAVLVAGFAEPMERSDLDGPYLGVAAARASDAIRPTALDEICLAVVLGLEPREKISELHHTKEYNASFRVVSSAG
jgi:hypothetical protein